VKAPVSPAVDAVVLRCLDKDATRRYPSVNAFLTALREATEEPNQVESQTRLVLAVNAEVVLPATDMDDDTTYAALAHVMDTLEQGLRAEHFILALQTGTALLGVRPVAAGITPALALRPLRELQAEAQRLAEAVHARVHLCLHHGEAETRGDSGEAEVVGGPVTHVATWNVRDPGGFAITRPASQYLEETPPQ
ncbi:serine/threonine protein kinase, partial [Corallococcus exiguus]|nr:serine/threonine protein kinase [Corallococcus exiguus]